MSLHEQLKKKGYMVVRGEEIGDISAVVSRLEEDVKEGNLQGFAVIPGTLAHGVNSKQYVIYEKGRVPGT